MNILSHGVPVGTCGARIVSGTAEPYNIGGSGSSRHAISTDGSRAFFEATPGSECSARADLYMRETGTDTTLDIGEYRFMAADKSGTNVLLEKRSGGTREFFLYNIESRTIKPTFSFASSTTSTVKAAEDDEGFTAIYINAGGGLTPEAPPVAPGSSGSGFEASDLYRYDVSTGRLHFVVEATGLGGPGNVNTYGAVTPDGRYDYFAADRVFGVPGGIDEQEAQVYRYDNTEGVVQCMSCAFLHRPRT